MSLGWDEELGIQGLSSAPRPPWPVWHYGRVGLALSAGSARLLMTLCLPDLGPLFPSGSSPWGSFLGSRWSHTAEFSGGALSGGLALPRGAPSLTQQPSITSYTT